MKIPPKVLIIVPAYNEEEVIQGTLTNLIQVKKQREDLSIDICVVNDGSSDSTSKKVNSLQEVILLDLPYNLGIGGAMQTGYKYAWNNGYDIAIQFDADGQHHINDLDTIIKPLITGNVDMTVGSRFVEKTDYKGASLRRVGIYYFSWLLFILTRQRFTDPTSGYRAINRNALKEFALYYPKDYPEPEVLIYLHRKGYKIVEKSVNMVARQGGVSSITPIKSMYYMLKVTLSIFMQKVIKG
jgi:glycosyltransferase involved in cell wall biosynthesis